MVREEDDEEASGLDKIIRRSEESLLVKLTNSEIKYREKFLPNLSKLRNEQLVCTVCDEALAHEIRNGGDLRCHKSLRVLVCEEHYQFYEDGIFSADEDGDDKYCRWCAQGGELNVCSTCTCTFCKICLDRNLSFSALKAVEKDDWQCPVCAPRPIFGSRTICWGALQLNRIGKEKKRLQMKLRKEKLENIAKMKRESEKKKKKSPLAEALDSPRKRRQDITDSDDDSDSSMPYVPAKKPKIGPLENGQLNGHQVEHKVKISGRKKYIDSTTSSEEDSTDSKKISNFKHQRRKKRKTYVSDESSEELNLESGMKSSDESEKQKSPSAEGTVKNKTPRKSLFRDEHTSSSLVNSKKDKISGDIGEECRNENKPKTHSCSNVDEVMGVEMPELIKEENSQVRKSTLPRSPSPSIFEHVEVKESAIAIDDDSDNRLANDDLNIKQKFTKVDGTREIEECVNGIINSKKSTMNKNRLEGIGFLLHSAREMRDLGEVIGHRAIRFRENKINKNNISSFDDVFHTADKLKTLFGEIHYSYSLIGESLDANMKSWKSLLGLDAYPDRTAPGLEDSASSASGNVVNSVDVKDEQEVVIEQPACEKDSSDKKPSFQESVNLAPEDGRKSEDSVTENENCKLEKSNIGDGSTHGQTVDGTMDSTHESTESAKKTAVEECVENISKDDPVDLQTCSDVLKETSSKMSEDDPSEEMGLALSESPDQSNVNNKDSLVKKNEMQNENSVEQHIEEGKSDAVVAMSNDDDVTSVFHPRDKGIGGNLLVTATDNNDCSDEIQKTNVTDEQTKITDNFAENDQIAKNAKEMEWPEKSEDEDDLEADDDEVQVPDENEVDEDDEALQSLLNASSEDEIGASESDEDVSDEMSIEESDVEIKKIVKIVMKKRVLAKKNKSYVNPGDGNAEQVNTELEISSGEDKSLKEDESSDDESDGTVGQQDNEEDDIKKTDAKENASPPNDDTDVVKKITISEKDDAEVKNQESEPDGKADASQQETKDGVEENNQLDSDVEIEQLTDLSNLKRKKGNIKYVFETNEDGSGISSSDSDEEQSEKKQRKPYNKQSKQKRIDEKNELLGFLDDSNKQEDEDVTATTNKELERLEREAAANESSSDEGLTSLEAFTRKMHEENRQMEAQESSRHLQQLLASSSDSDPDSADELDISDLDTRKKKDKHKKIVEKTEREVKDKEPDSENADEELDKNSDSEQKENEIATEEQSDSGSEKRCKELDENPDSDKEEQNEGGETDEECDEQIAKPSDETKRKELSSDDSEPEAVAANNDDDGANDESSDNGNSSEGLFRDKKRTKRNSWRQDKLLRTKISETDTSDEERWWKRNARRLRKKDEEERLKHSESDSAKIGSDENKIKKSPKKRVKPTLVSSNEEDEPSSVASSSAESSDSSIFQKKKKKRKKGSSDSDVVVLSDNVKQKKKKRRQANSDNSSDESGKSDDETIKLSQKSELGESPGKGGRKNIRKVMTKHDLAAATRAAARAEDERKRRIAARQKLYNELFEVKEAEIMEKLVLDFDADTKTELISVNKDLVAKMKPHQAKGVKFMWDSCFESLNELKSKKGSGCILAHCMGLGKTFQVVSLVHTILVHKDTCVRTVLVVCPLSTVLNWAAEFRKWLKGVDGGGGSTINVHNLTQSKTEHERSYRLKQWHENGGVMIMGYEMFRTLTSDKGKKKAVRPSVKETYHKTLINPGADLVVCDEGHTLKNETTQLSKAMSRIKTLRRIVLTGTPMQNNLKEYHCMVQFVKPNLLGTRKEFLNQFVNPISNGQFVDSTESDVKVMKRRAHVLHKMLEGLVQRCDYTVLTPFLPPKQEYVVSLRLSAVQERLYKFYLAHFAQRAGTSGSQLFQDWQALGRIWTHPLVLKWSTDKYKRENENQVLDKKGSLFSFFNKHKKLEDDAETGSLKDFINDESSLSISLSSSSASSDEEGNKRPKIKKTKSSGKIDPNDLPTEINLISSEEEDETEKEKEDEGKQKGKEGEKEHDKQDENDAASNESNDDKENKDMNKEEKAKDKKQGEGETAGAQVGAVDDEAKLNVGTRSSDWWSGLVGREQLDDLNSSAKLVVLLAIIRECELIEDKVLVFSQSLFSLNLIEHFLRQLDGQLMRPSAEEEGEGEPIRWVKNKDYLRLDGSTPTESRSQWCREFNRENNNRLRLFLISTRAGGLGINLTAANRVVIFDASWNPSHDIQSIFRIYRFGQKKPCYVYRFIAHGTMEEKVYERQVAKQSLASRVVDEQQIHRHYSTNDLGELYTYTAPLPRDQRPTPALPKDRLMAELLTQHSDWIEKYHEHDSLLENVAEEELNEEERQAAWDDYENDKKRAFLPITQQTGAGGVNYQNEMVFKNQMELYYKSLRARYPAATEQQMSDMLQSLMTNWFHQSQPTTPQVQASGTAQQQPTQPGPSTSSQQFTVPTYTAQQLQNFEKNLAVNMQTVQGGARQRGDIIGNAEIRKQNAAVNMQTVQGGARQRGDIIGNAEIRKQNAAVNMQTVQGGARQRGDIIGNAEIRKQNAAMRLKGDGNGRMAYSNLVRQQNLATAVDKLKSIYPNGLPRQRQRVNTKPLPGNPITPTQNTIANTSRVQNAVGRMQPNTSHVQNQSVNSRQLPSNLRRIIYPNATSQPNTLMRNGSGRIQHNTARTQSPASVQNARLVQPVTRQARLPNTLQTGRTSLTPNLNPVTGASQLKTYSNKAMMRSVLNNQSRLNEKLMQRKGTEQMNANANARQLEEMSKRYKSSRGPVTQPPKKISVVTLDDDTNNQPD